MELTARTLSGGFHAAVDVAVATAAGVVGVVLFYPIYIAALPVKAVARVVHRWYEKIRTDGHGAALPAPDARSGCTRTRSHAIIKNAKAGGPLRNPPS